MQSVHLGQSYNPKLADVVSAFNAVDEDGTRHSLSGEPWIPNIAASHVQGVMAYGQYLVLTQNNVGYSRGYLMVGDVQGGEYCNKYETPFAHYNHPAGGQVIGDYAAVAIENSAYDKGYVAFYDLTTVSASAPPALLDVPRIERPGQGAGAVGITSWTAADGTERYLLAVYDNHQLDFYTATAPIGSASCAFELLQSASTGSQGMDGVFLLTDLSQNIYVVGLEGREKTFLGVPVGISDHAVLYTYDLETNALQLVTRRHLSTSHGGIVGLYGVHFRWGCGLSIESDGSLQFLATQRNFVGYRLTYNVFA